MPETAGLDLRVMHHRLARQELRMWGLPITQSRIDKHMLSQLTEHTYGDLLKMGMRRGLQDLLRQLNIAATPTRVRVEGTGPWTLLRCRCCTRKECGIICVCRPARCECNAPELCTFRECTGEDVDTFAPNGITDDVALVETLMVDGPRPVDDWPYADFVTLDQAIERSFNSPFWPTEETASADGGSTATASP